MVKFLSTNNLARYIKTKLNLSNKALGRVMKGELKGGSFEITYILKKSSFAKTHHSSLYSGLSRILPCFARNSVSKLDVPNLHFKAVPQINFELFIFLVLSLKENDPCPIIKYFSKIKYALIIEIKL